MTTTAVAEQAPKAQTKENEVSVKLTGAILKLTQLAAAGDKDGRSINFWAEEAIVLGLKAIERSRKYAKEQRNMKDFQKELSNDPAIAADPVKMQALLRKYRIGGVEKGQA